MRRKRSFKEKLEQLKSKIRAIEGLREGRRRDSRLELVFDMEEAKKKLKNFELNLSVRQGLPTYGVITFYHQDLTHFMMLKEFAGEYGFVVPVKGSKYKKILRGEKKLKYKKITLH